MRFELHLEGEWNSKRCNGGGGDSRVGKQRSQSQPEGNPLFSIFKVCSVD